MADDSATPLDYAPPDPASRRRRLVLQIGIVVGCALLLIAGVCGIVLSSAQTKYKQIHCSSNMGQIGQGIQLYLQDYRAYPSDLQAMARTQGLSSDVFVCPDSSDWPAKGATTLGAGACSYIYVGAVLPSAPPLDAVVALEDPANHSLEGGNVLFADGHVEWLGVESLVQILNDLEQGINPPLATTTLTPAQARKVYDTKWKALMPQLKSGVWRVPATAPAK